MQEIEIDFCMAPDVLLETADGLVKLPAAEGVLILLANGLPAPEPMTIGLTQFILADRKVVLVCTELAQNHGTSVARSWPTLAEYVLKIADITDHSQAVFVEHYSSGFKEQSASHARDHFYLVAIRWNGDKAVDQEWKALTT